MMSVGSKGGSLQNTSSWGFQCCEYHKRTEKARSSSGKQDFKKSKRVCTLQVGWSLFPWIPIVEFLPVLALLGAMIAAWHTAVKAFSVLHLTDGKMEANTGNA